MIGLEMLDVAIGVIFIYLLLSLICSALNELIEARLKMRAVDLERGIRELLNDPDGNGLARDLYKHALVCCLFKGSYAPNKIKGNSYEFRSDLPSYIPARNFALALMDIMMPATVTTPSGAMGATSAPTVPLLVPDGAALVPAATPKSLQPLRNSISKITNPEVKEALLALVDAAGDDVSKARENIENWYNSSMDRVSGWYKRRVQKIILVLGFLTTIAVNADTFAIFNSLINDRPLRNAVVIAAAQTQEPGTNLQTPEVRLDSTVNKILSFGLPIGWDWRSLLNKDPQAVTNLHAIPNTVGGWALKLIGWFVTAMAISLGAPFWFDVLNKFMVVRATVKPHEKSQEEGSEDR